MDSKEIKYSLLHYFRYKRQGVAATEVQASRHADILAALNGKIIEVEVKISIADLKNEIKKRSKKMKHRCMSQEIKGIPNQFYFCVPNDLEKETEDFINEHFPKYGLMVYEQAIGHWEDRIRVVKRALDLSPGDGNYKYLHNAIEKRICSELNRFYRESLTAERRLRQND